MTNIFLECHHNYSLSRWLKVPDKTQRINFTFDNPPTIEIIPFQKAFRKGLLMTALQEHNYLEGIKSENIKLYNYLI